MRPMMIYASSTDATYGVSVSDQNSGDARTWAAFLAEEAERRGWSKNRLAKALPVDRATFYRWLRAESTPDLSSVRLVVEALGVDMATALKAAGQPADGAAVDEDDWELRTIKESGLSETAIKYLVAETLAKRERDRAHRREELARQIEFYRGASGD
jgi:transcriptional regulator with XRE-family HTH domain